MEQEHFDDLVDRIHARAASKAREKLQASLTREETDMQAKIRAWLRQCEADGEKTPLTFEHAIKNAELVNSAHCDEEIKVLMERVEAPFRGKRYKVVVGFPVMIIGRTRVTLTVTAKIEAM